MKIPDRFPSGCLFAATFSGDEYVKFPDGSVFKASDDGESLLSVGAFPDRAAAPMDEESFLSTAAKSRAFFAQKRGAQQ
jgi:hypothetical protein